MTHLSEEDVGGCVHRLGGRGADGDLQEPADLHDHPLHGAVVVEDLHEQTEEEDDRQDLHKIKKKSASVRKHLTRFYLESEDGADLDVALRLAGDQVAVDESGSGRRVIEERRHFVGDASQNRAANFPPQDDQPEDELQGQAPRHLTPQHLSF